MFIGFRKSMSFTNQWISKQHPKKPLSNQPSIHAAGSDTQEDRQYNSYCILYIIQRTLCTVQCITIRRTYIYELI